MIDKSKVIELISKLEYMVDENNPETYEIIEQIKKFLFEHEELVNQRSSLISLAKEQEELVADWVDDNPGICIYCGRPDKEQDHLLPLPWTGQAARHLVPTVPACRPCNSALSDFPNPVIYDRCQLIAEGFKDYDRYEVLKAGGAHNVY